LLQADCSEISVSSESFSAYMYKTAFTLQSAYNVVENVSFYIRAAEFDYYCVVINICEKTAELSV